MFDLESDEDLAARAAAAEAERKRREELAGARARNIAREGVAALRAGVPTVEVSGMRRADGLAGAFGMRVPQSVVFGHIDGKDADGEELAITGHAPGYGPDVVANQIEAAYGRFEDIPGWGNGKEWARAGREYSEQVAGGAPEAQRASVGDEEFRKNRHLMTPRQYAYMQDVGRTVDLLRGLRRTDDYANAGNAVGDAFTPNLDNTGPMQSAKHYWDRSNNARRTREDYDDPNYARFAGGDQAANEFLNDQTSPVARYLHVQNFIPSALSYGYEEPNLLGMLRSSDATQKAANLLNFTGRYRLGEVPVLDMPELPADATPEQVQEYDAKYFARMNELMRMRRDLQPPPDQNIVNDALLWQQRHMPTGGFVPGMEPSEPKTASRGVADLIGILRSMADGTFVAGMAAGVPARAAAAKAAAGRATDVAESATRMASGRHLRSLLASSPRAHDVAAAARARALAAAAKAESLRAPLIAHAGSELLEQSYPEVAIGGGLNYALSPEGGSTYDYWMQAAPSEQLNPEARDRAHSAMEQMHRTDPQSLWEDRHDEWARAKWNRENMRYVPQEGVYGP